MKWSSVCLGAGVFCGMLSLSAADTVVVVMEGASSDRSDGTSIYDHAADGAAHWSDNNAPQPGAVYEIPSKYTVGIQGGNSGQASVDFGGDAIILYGKLRWYGWSNSKYVNTKPITMKPGSTWNIYNGVGTYNYANYSIEGTESSPANFSSASRNDDNCYNYYKGKITGGDAAFMRWFCTSSSGYGQRMQLDADVLAEYYGTIRFDGERSIGQAVQADWPCSLEVANSARFEFAENTATSSVRQLKVDGSSELRLTAAANKHVIAISERLVLADGAVLTVNKINAMPAVATASDDNVRQYPIFLLSKEAFEDPSTSIGNVTVNCGWSMDAIPAGFLYTNILANGGAEIGWTHRPIFKQTAHGGYGNSVFKDDSANIANLLSDGKPMHAGDYVLGDYNEYPQTKSSPYICPANCVVFKTQTYRWYNCSICFTNAVLWAVSGAGAFWSNDGGNFGYTVGGNLKVVPNADGSAWTFKNRRSHMDTFECDISGGGLLNFAFKTDVSNDPLNRWYCTYRLFGDNSGFSGKMSFSMCANGMYDAFSTKGAPEFKQGSHSNIVVWVRKPTAFGGALPEFDPEAVDFGNWTRLMTTNDIAFTEATRGWAFRTNISISVDDKATLTLANPIVCSGGGDIVVNAGNASGRMGYEGDPNLLIKVGGGLVLGGSMSVADGEPASTLRMEKGSLRFAAKNALNGLNVSFGAGASLKVDPNTADEELKTFGAVLTGNVSFPADGSIPVELTSAIGPETTVGVVTVSDALADAVLKKLTRPKGAANNPKLVAKGNGDGTTTIALTSVKSGLILVVR